MAVLRSLLALYGALDRAVIDSEDPGVAATVALFAPGITARNAEWSNGIRDFVTGSDRAVPSAEQALADIIADSPTVPELSRMVYAIGALCHTPDFAPLRDDPQNIFARALALAGPEYDGGTDADIARGNALLDLLREKFSSRAAWQRVTGEAVERLLLSADVASVLPCDAYTIPQGNVTCVAIKTFSEAHDIYFENLKNVVDPLNWSRNQPHLFCEMRKQDPYVGPDGWNRVLETVSLGCDEGLDRLVTALKYQKVTKDADHAVLFYDLDKSGSPLAGDGRVLVDKGFIQMERIGDPGVRVTTMKIVHIQPFDPLLQAYLICQSGYAHQAQEMIFGNAKNPPADTVPWEPAVSQSTGSPTNQFATAAAATGTSGGLASVTAGMWLDCVQHVVDKNSEVATKWQNNQLTVDDLVDYSSDLGGLLASAPYRYLKALSQSTGSGEAVSGGTAGGGT